MKKTMSLLLSLVMVITAIAAMPFAANAEEHVHNFGTGKDAEYEVEWDENNKCTCTGVCKECHETVTETVQGVLTETTKPTCTEWGMETYTATFTKGFDVEITKNPGEEPLNHFFGTGETTEYKVSWSEDNICTCTGKCKRCGKKIKEKVTPKKKVIKKATCTKWGKTKYIAKFTKGFDTETEVLEDIKPLGHVLSAKTKKCKRCNAKAKKNTLVAKGKTAKVKNGKAAKIQRKKAIYVAKAKGKVSFKKAKGNSKIVVKKNGAIVVKKGIKKGTYKVSVKVKAAGKGLYLPVTKKVIVKIVVK